MRRCKMERKVFLNTLMFFLITMFVLCGQASSEQKTGPGLQPISDQQQELAGKDSPQINTGDGPGGEMPSPAVQRVRPSAPAQALRPTAPAQQMKPMEPEQAVRPQAPRPASPEQSLRPQKPLQQMRPAKPAQQMRPAAPR